MAAVARLSPVEIWQSRIDLEHEIDQIGNASLRRKLAGVIAKARGEGLSKDDNFPHLVSGDNPRIVDKPPTIFHLDPKADARHKLGVQRLLATYRKGLNPDRLRLLDRFTLKDLAFKAVGARSVGSTCGLWAGAPDAASARAGDPAAITGYSGKSEVLDDAIASFAMAYAKQTILDHAALVKAKDSATSAKTIMVRTAKAA